MTSPTGLPASLQLSGHDRAQQLAARARPGARPGDRPVPLRVPTVAAGAPREHQSSRANQVRLSKKFHRTPQV